MFKLKLAEEAVEAVWMCCRRVALHTSAMFFGTDFVDCCLGKAMIFHHWWEEHHLIFVSYSAWAATMIVYIDGHHERVKKIARKVAKEDGEA